MRPLRALARQASSPAAATPAAPPAGRAFVTRHGQTLSFPRLGLGTAPLGGLFSAVTAADAAATLAAGLAAGMHYVDTAPLYGFGDAERRAGAFLRAHAAAGGAAARRVEREAVAGSARGGGLNARNLRYIPASQR